MCNSRFLEVEVCGYAVVKRTRLLCINWGFCSGLLFSANNSGLYAFSPHSVRQFLPRLFFFFSSLKINYPHYAQGLL